MIIQGLYTVQLFFTSMKGRKSPRHDKTWVSKYSTFPTATFLGY